MDVDWVSISWIWEGVGALLDGSELLIARELDWIT